MTKPEETAERTWYYVTRQDSIEAIIVVRESPSSLWVKTHNRDEPMVWRRNSAYYDYFPTIEEAQAFVLKRAEEKLARAEAEVAELREKLVKLRGGA